MVSALLVSDFPLYEGADGKVYSEPQIGGQYWHKFHEAFSEVGVVGRVSTNRVTQRHVCVGELVDEVVCVPNLRRLPFGPLDYRRCREQIARHAKAYDVLICRIPGENGLIAASVAEAQNKPWAVEMAGCGWNGLWNYGHWTGKAYAPLFFHRLRRTVQRAPYVFYVTKNFLQTRYPNEGGHTVACSDVDIPEPCVAVLAKRLERIASLDEPVRLGLIGTLHGRFKGIQTVMEGVARVRHKLPPVTFHVLGGGEVGPWEREAEKWGVADITFFDGLRSPGEEVWEWLDDVDIYLQPSLTEGLPRALIEAMSRGCPAIGTRCAGIPELLRDDCLVGPGDACALGAKLVQATNGREWFRRNAEWNWQKSGDYASPVLSKRRLTFWSEVASATGAQS